MRARIHYVVLAGVLMACGGKPETPPANRPPMAWMPVSADDKAAAIYVDDLAHGRRPNTPEQQKWTALEAMAGRYVEISRATAEPAPNGAIVNLTCDFERTKKLVRLTFDGAHKVVAFEWASSPEELEARVRNIIDKANEGDFDTAERSFGATMRERLPPDKLSAAWKQLLAQAGRFRAVDSVKFTAVTDHKSSAIATTSFERTKLLVKAFFDERDELIGLFFEPENPWAPPSYAHPTDVVESDVMVGDNPGLPGNLVLPKGEGKVPVVVLIHGSGPGDRDEAIGGVRVFKDLALGLAAKGIGVLRYDKRSRVAPKGIVTEKDEVIDPAVVAIQLLKAQPRADAYRIFVIGHSQGGNLAPRIAAAAPDIAGYVVMAGNTRPLQDLVVDQYQYFTTLHPDDQELKDKLVEAQEFKKAVENPALKPQDVPKSPFGGGITGAYFLYQRGYDPVATAKTLALPMLVLQGGRDYQVTSKDLDRWKTGLSGAGFATIKQYPADNHLFVPGSGPPNPEEYQAPGHVDEQVVTDIAEWILKTKPR